MPPVTVQEASLANAPEVFRLVKELLRELGEEEKDAGVLNEGALLRAWQSRRTSCFVFLAMDGETPVGVMTLAESFAIYANGALGIINEMYVAPAYRSAGVGSLLIDAAKALGRRRGWHRIEVTAPEAERWARTRRFYEREGFVFAGPKLKRPLP